MDRSNKTTEKKVKPLLTVSNLSRLKSPHIISTFLSSPYANSSVNIEVTGRQKRNVYIALHQYLKIHPNIPVEVNMIEGTIVLSKR